MGVIDVQVFGNSIGFAPGTLHIQQKLGQRATLDFEVHDQPVALNIYPGQLAEVYEDDVRRFAGQVDEVSFFVHPSTSVRTYTVRCIDYATLMDRVTVPKHAWLNETVERIIRDIAFLADFATLGVNTSHVSAPLIVDKWEIVDRDVVSAQLDKLAKVATGLGSYAYYWWMDYDHSSNVDNTHYLWFQPFRPNLNAANISLGVPGGAGDPGLPFVNFRAEEPGSIVFKQTREQYANKVHLRLGNYVTDPVTEVITWDGTTVAWALSHPVSARPTVKLNGVVQTVGIDGVDNQIDPVTGQEVNPQDFYWNAGSQTIVADVATTAPVNSPLEVTYTGQDQRMITLQDDAEIAARRAIEGPPGIYEEIIDTNDPATAAKAGQIADAELSKRAAMSMIITGSLWDAARLVGELQLGQWIYVNADGYNPACGGPPEVDAAGFYLLRTLEMFDEGGRNGVLWRRVECVQGPTIYDSLEYLKELLAKGPPAAQTVAQPPVPVPITIHFDAPVVGDQSDWGRVDTQGSAAELCFTAVVAPSGIVYIDVQVSKDNGGTWQSLLNSAYQLPAGAHIGPVTTSFLPNTLGGLTTLNVGDFVRGIIASGSATDGQQLNGILKRR